MLRLLCVRAAVAFLLLTTVSVAPADDARPKRYLIIHADDAGMSHSVNVATIEGMEKGVVSSASIMVPCPWFNEIAEYARKNPDKDFGIHLTLNSEWDGYRWGPVAPREKVPSLLDKDGYLWKSDNDTAANGRAEEVEIELRAQIERARKFGVPVTHLDTHMGAVFARADFAEIYIRLGIEYNLPVLFPSPGFASIIEKGFPALDGKAVEFSKLLQKNDLSTLDYILQYYKSGPDDERKALYLKNLDILPPGISEFIIHCGTDHDELKAITGSYVIRESDRKIFTDPSWKEELAKRNIELIGWKQAQELKSQKTAKAPSADDGKYLILHADDAGMSHNVNVATIETMTKGIASSCSIMVPCPWFPEFAKYARENPKLDYGIHLTVNSEWKHFRWGPVAPREKVPSLLDKDGYLWPDVPDVALNAKASEVEIELHAQIDRALKFGVPLSHLDTHMGSLVSRPDLIEVYVNTALKYKLPILWTRVRSEESLRKYPALKENLDKLTKALEDAGLPVLDTLTTGVNGDDLETRKRAYLKVIREFKPGVHQIIIHCGVGNEELKAITGRWSQRDEDRRIFTDPAVIAEVQKAGVKLIGWKDAREMLRVRTAQAE